MRADDALTGLQARLPDPAGAEAPVVILRLRGRTSLSSTFIKLVGDHADRLEPGSARARRVDGAHPGSPVGQLAGGDCELGRARLGRYRR
jgi:hypothetical protein